MFGDDVEELREVAEFLLKATTMPILDINDFPEEEIFVPEAVFGPKPTPTSEVTTCCSPQHVAHS
jgi:hypothetical protein